MALETDYEIYDNELYEARFGYKEKRFNFWFYLILVTVFFALFLGLRYWVNTYGIATVDGSSMVDTLQDEDRLFMKYVKEEDDYQRGDVIVVYVGDYPECQDLTSPYLIKRLIGLEGDKIKCVDGQLYICYKGESEYVEMDDPYAYYQSEEGKNACDFAEYVVGENEIFFLGDNRMNSCDSRYQQTGGSRLDRLYQEKDIYATVSTWSIDHRDFAGKVANFIKFFQNIREKIFG